MKNNEVVKEHGGVCYGKDNSPEFSGLLGNFQIIAKVAHER